MNNALLRRPSAFVPIGMSAAALVTLVVHVVRFGVAPEADEGTAAHLWQLLMAGQIPFVLFFAFRWVAASPARGWAILALQFAAALAAAFPVWWFQW